MAKLPTIKRLLQEDFKDQSSWIGRLLSPLNQFLEAVTSSLNKGLTFSDNHAAEIRTVTLDGNFPVRVSLSSLRARPSLVWKARLERQDGQAVVLATAFDFTWSYQSEGNGISIDSVVGITPTASTKYLLTLVCAVN